MKNARIEGLVCPYCAAAKDAAVAVGNAATPTPGSIDLCIYCAGISLYTDALKLRRPTHAEMDALKASPQWREIDVIRLAITRLHEERGAT